MKINNLLLFQDDDVVAFPDIKPAAKHHTLVISRQHLVNAKVLTSEHKALGKVLQMLRVLVVALRPIKHKFMIQVGWTSNTIQERKNILVNLRNKSK